MALDNVTTSTDKPDTKPAAEAAPADKAPAPEKAAATETADKASAVDAGAKPEADASTDDADDGGATEDRQAAAGDDWLDDDAADTTATDADGKEAPAKDAKKPDLAADWRATALKVAEDKLLKKAKTDDDKKAVTQQTDRLKKQLARYGSPEAAILAGMEAQEKLRAGAKVEKPGLDAKPEDVAKWRAEQGLPVEPADIAIPRVEITTPDGRRVAHKWSDQDKPFHDSFRELAFDIGLSQEAVNKAVQWQVREVEEASKRQREMITHIDKADRKEMLEALREEFADEVKPRMNMVTQLINDREVFPEDVAAMLWNARDPSTGKRVINQPALVKFFAERAVEQYGEGGLIVGDKRVALEDEESKLRTLMKNNYDEYLKTGADKKLEAILEKKSTKRGRAA